MRVINFALGIVMGLSAPLSAHAYENYIPLGTGYSPTVDSLPRFDSDEGKTSQRTDEYETELYLESRKKAQQDSRMREFFSDRNSTGSDTHIDY